jgi:hypothetical protein
MKNLFLYIFLLLVVRVNGNSQESRHEYSQVVRGMVVDKHTQSPLPGANVVLRGVEPLKGTISDDTGEFRMEDVPLGRHRVEVSFVGYHIAYINNIVVNSARETILFIELEQKVETTDEVIVLGNSRKGLAINKMASVSARTFTVEEAARYAGSREDVARMAVNFAGVSGANDQRNDIIVRGNTPGGVLWRLEGVDIPNPNHFAASGTTGGPVGMLNNNTLRNSDFFTGAFPAEFANVFSGAFDLNMREGNNEKYEFMGQAGFNGFELGAEGPFKEGSKSSFLANYRYSTLQIFDLLGISFGTTGIPKYQDLSCKLNFPLTKGRLSWFALAGISSIAMLDSEKSESDLFSFEGTDIINGSNSVATGVNYSRFHGGNAYSRFILSYVNQNATTEIDEFRSGRSAVPFYRENNLEERVTFKYLFNIKMNRRLWMQSGLTLDRFGYKLNARQWKEEDDKWLPVLNSSRTFPEGPNLYRIFTQIAYKFSDFFEIKPGINFIYFGLNDTYSAEPRFGLSWKTGNRTSINAGYGKHSKIQSMATYFLETVFSDGTVILTNKDLGLTSARHWVLGFDAMAGEHFRIKTEAYYQYLYNVPVERQPSYYSMLNTGAEWGLNTRDFLINGGKGWNYGLELTLEKFYHNNYYFLTTFSLFDSRYTGSDNIKRNTAFNGNFVFNTLAGREFPIDGNSALVFDLKITWAGGKRYIPVDMEASRQNNGSFGTVYFEDQAYSRQFPDYFKSDIKIGYRRNGEKVSQLWEFYLENATNHKNPLTQTYSRREDAVININQLGIFPLFNYRIYF